MKYQAHHPSLWSITASGATDFYAADGRERSNGAAVAHHHEKVLIEDHSRSAVAQPEAAARLLLNVERWTSKHLADEFEDGMHQHLSSPNQRGLILSTLETRAQFARAERIKYEQIVNRSGAKAD